MGIKIRSLSVVVGVALATGAALAIPASAAAPLPHASGTLSCSVKGSVKYVPPLVAGGTTPSVVTLATTEFGCTGTGDATNITGGTSKTSHTTANNDCASVLQAPFTTSQGLLKWKVQKLTQKWAASTIQFTAGSSDTGPPITTDSSGSSIDDPGTTADGSFTGDIATAHAQIKQTQAQIITACTSVKGLKSLTIVAPQSTFTLTAP